jgi:shikimate kinase
VLPEQLAQQAAAQVQAPELELARDRQNRAGAGIRAFLAQPRGSRPVPQQQLRSKSSNGSYRTAWYRDAMRNRAQRHLSAIKPSDHKSEHKQHGHDQANHPPIPIFFRNLPKGGICFIFNRHIAQRSTPFIAGWAMTEISNPEACAQIVSQAQAIDRPIVLVGLMGVGKSTVGRRLSERLNRDFVDADKAIEEAAQRSVGEIFEEFGEAYFRDGERRVIARLIEEGSGVIATGGGAFVDEETRALILEKAIAVWIDCDVETLVERTSRRNTRPLLKTGDPHEILSRLAKEREPFYSQAQIKVTSEDGPHAHTVAQILEGLSQWTQR